MLHTTTASVRGRIALGLALAASVSLYAGHALASSTPGDDVITRPGGRLGGEPGTAGYVRPGGARAQAAAGDTDSARGRPDRSQPAACAAGDSRRSVWNWRRLLGSCGR